MKMKVALVAICTLFWASLAPGATINVPGDESTIQAAIDAAVAGDVVTVDDGIWSGAGNRDLRMTLPITVRSASGDPNSCIIDCGGVARAFIFVANQNVTDPNALADANDGFVVNGFKIMNGYAPADDDTTISATNRGCGGGIIIDAGGPIIDSCIFTLCEADIFGGGILINGGDGDTNAMVRSCVFHDNTAPWGGGAIAVRGQATPDIINCLVVQNTADQGGGIYVEDSTPNIELSTVADNSGYQGVYCDSSRPTFVNCILWGNSIFNVPPYDSDSIVATNCITDSVDITGTNILYDDPMFTSGMYGSLWGVGGDYYLNPLSPAIDAGRGSLGNPYSSDYFLTLPRYTDPGHSVRDIRAVDIGFHYPAYTGPDIPATFTITIDSDPDNGRVVISWVQHRDGTWDFSIPWESSGIYALNVGDTVYMTAEPDPNYRVEYWTGTNDDDIFDLDNLSRNISLYEDSVVHCSFEQNLPRTLNFPGQYADLQYAVLVARTGDTIIVHPGVYTLPGYGAYKPPRYAVVARPCITINGKAITIRSVAPSDPATVAATVFRQSDPTNPSFVPAWGWWTVFEILNCGRDTVISGITIENAIFRGADGMPGTTSDPVDPPGKNGSSIYGAGMYIIGSPTISNCVFRNCRVTAGNGGNAVARNNLGYDGGHGGYAGGGAVFVSGSPLFRNITFDGCSSTAGNGGNGADARDRNGRGGSYKIWSGVSGGDGTRIVRQAGGGAALVYSGNAEFEDCTFANNTTSSGHSGIGSSPQVITDMGSIGGAVFVGSDRSLGATLGASASFTRCVFTGNWPRLRQVSGYNFESAYIAYGGAIAADENGSITMTDCTFTGNMASIGGAIYWAGTTSQASTFRIEGSSFSENEAFQGGAIYGYMGTAYLLNDRFELNAATTASSGGDPNQNAVGVLTQGGAVYMGGVESLIGDCVFKENSVSHSGGALAIVGHNRIGGQVPRVYNNLFLDNKADRDGGAVVCTDGSEPNIANCTMVLNEATGSSGSGGGMSVTAGGRAHIENCLLFDNTASVGSQLSLVDPNGNGVYQNSSANVKYSMLQSGQTGIANDPGSDLYYGTNNVEGSVLPRFIYGYTDERFITTYSLESIGAGSGQDVDSPCIDKGSINLDPSDPNLLDLADRSLLPLGRYAYTLRTDGARDTGIIDIGYHRRKVGVYPRGDIDYSGAVNSLDEGIRAIFGRIALALGSCAYPDWCEGTDLNKDTRVNLTDFALLAQLYGAGDVTAPIPNPMQWLLSPTANSTSSIIMTATTAIDNSGNAVEYLFDCVSAGGHSSGWQTSSTYTDAGLTAGLEYGYQVKARDDAATPNETAWSPTLYAYVGEDGRAPTPNPSQWETPPYAISSDTVAMTARSAVDASGVQYYFRCESGTNGYDSSWQASPSFTNTGLLPSTVYKYTVKTRDLSAALNTGALSSPQASVTTLSSPDIVPPVPSPAQWFLRPVGISTTEIMMMAMPAYDLSGVEYFFECTFGGHDHDSGWQLTPAYTAIGLLESTRYDFRLLVRDRSVAKNACEPSETVSAWTLTSGGGGPGPGPGTLPPTPNPMQFSDTPSPMFAGLTLTTGLPTQVLATYTPTGTLGYWHVMTAAKAVDSTGSSIGVEYYFQCVTDDRRSSGWILGDPAATTGPGYFIQAGSPGWPQIYVWRVKARDIWGTETDWSAAAMAGGTPF